MKIVVTSGGTGGHIYPAVSLIKYLENNGEKVIFVGGKNKLEEEIAKKEDIEFIGLKFGKRNGILNKFKFIVSMVKGFFLTLKVLKKEKVDVIVGFGNYISFPVCLAGRMLRIPLILHEQNSTMGKANILLGFFANKIGYSIPLMKEYHKRKLVSVGNPRSSECLKPAKNISNLDVTKNNILIFMGSLGSSTINDILKQFINENNDSNIYHIVTGKKHYDTFIKDINEKDNIIIYPYIEDMISFMKRCDLVITRSGATTISEIITLGLPSILIPSPYVVKNHQFYNANYLFKNDACLMIEEKKLNANELKEKIEYLLENNEMRIKLRLNSLKLAVFDSNKKIYNLILETKNER